MELKVWSKTFLNVYRNLEKVTQAIDKIVLSTGLNSMMEVELGASKIMELTSRKINLINLKLFIEKMLNSLKEEDTKLLMLKYVDNLKGDKIASLLNMSARTYFRKSNMAMKSLELAIKRAGKTHELLLQELKQETWILDLFQKSMVQETLISSETNNIKKEEKINESKMLHFAYDSYKKISPVNLFN